MKHGSRRAKGRRLQVTIAEQLSATFKLTIEATKPTRAGVRQNGATYVDETFHTPPDIRVRASGRAGSDVALLSTAAQQIVAWKGKPWWIECKNAEGWALDNAMWEHNKPPSVIVNAFEQIARDPQSAGWKPLVVLGRNRHIPLAVVDTLSANIPFTHFVPCLRVGKYVVLPFDLLMLNFMGHQS